MCQAAKGRRGQWRRRTPLVASRTSRGGRGALNAPLCCHRPARLQLPRASSVEQARAARRTSGVVGTPRSPPASSFKQRGASAGCAAHERRGGQRLANGAAARPSGTRGPLRGRGCPRPPSAMRRLSVGRVCVCGRGEWGARGARAACMLARNNRKQPVQQKSTVMPRVRDLAFAWHLF